MEKNLLMPDSDHSPPDQSCKDPFGHIAQMMRIFEIVTDDFCWCAAGHCDVVSCTLTAAGVVNMVDKVERAVERMDPRHLRALNLSAVEEARYVEYPIAQRWISAIIWQMAERHHIDTDELEGDRFSLWPLRIVRAVAQIVAVVNPRALLIQGNGTVSSHTVHADV
jgi:hypothetical protein